ncbi:hypothetical protein HELA111659_08355 [Helicobacter labetoulli]
MIRKESKLCPTQSLCHTDSPPCHTEPLGEVSKNAESTTESKRDFSPTAQNDKEKRDSKQATRSFFRKQAKRCFFRK